MKFTALCIKNCWLVAKRILLHFLLANSFKHTIYHRKGILGNTFGFWRIIWGYQKTYFSKQNFNCSHFLKLYTAESIPKHTISDMFRFLYCKECFTACRKTDTHLFCSMYRLNPNWRFRYGFQWLEFILNFRIFVNGCSDLFFMWIFVCS